MGPDHPVGRADRRAFRVKFSLGMAAVAAGLLAITACGPNGLGGGAKHPDFSGTWGPNRPVVGTPTNIVAAGAGNTVEWAPLSKGAPETRKLPTDEELVKSTLDFTDTVERLAAEDDQARLNNRNRNPPPSATPAGLAKHAEISEGTYIKDYNEGCLPPSVVGGMNGSSMQIAQTKDFMIIANDTGYSRVIYLDERTDEEAFPTVRGYSIGKWEGDELVVTTTKIAAKFLPRGLRDGWPLSENVVLTERYKLGEDGKSMTVKRYFDDPDYYTERFGSMSYFAKTPNELLITQCIENLADQPWRGPARDLDAKIGNTK